MGRLNPLFESLKTLQLTYQNPSETLLDPPETLPTTEPATPQISYTVASGDLPSPSLSLYKKNWLAYIWAGGKFVTAGTLYWRMKKNGSSVANGSSSVAANTFYTIAPACFFDVAVGDVLEIALWSNQTDSNWDYKAYFVDVTRIQLLQKPTLLSPCNFTFSYKTLTLGSPSGGYPAARFSVQHEDINWANPSASPFNSSILNLGVSYGMYRLFMGDTSYANNIAGVRTSTTARPYYYYIYVIDKIVLRGLRLD